MRNATRILCLIFSILLSSAFTVGQSTPRASVNASPAHSPHSANRGVAVRSRPTILIQSDMDCRFGLDAEPSEQLKAGEIRKLPTTLGEHLVTAESEDGQDHWRSVVKVEKPQQSVVLIELVKVRAARQHAESEDLHSQQETRAEDAKAQELQQSAQDLAAKQDAVMRQRAQIEAQIESLQQKAQQLESQADSDRQSAEQAQQQAQIDASFGKGVGNVGSVAASIAAQGYARQANAEQAKARQLRTAIADLNQRLQAITLGTVEGANDVTPHPRRQVSTLTATSVIGQTNATQELGFESSLAGVQVLNLTRDVRRSYRIRSILLTDGRKAKVTGVVISSISANNTTVRAAGLRPGDLLQSILVSAALTTKNSEMANVSSVSDFARLSTRCTSPGIHLMLLGTLTRSSNGALGLKYSTPKYQDDGTANCVVFVRHLDAQGFYEPGHYIALWPLGQAPPPGAIYDFAGYGFRKNGIGIITDPNGITAVSGSR